VSPRGRRTRLASLNATEPLCAGGTLFTTIGVPAIIFIPRGFNFRRGRGICCALRLNRPNTEVTFVFDFGSLTNPGHSPSGFSLPLVDLYIDINQSAWGRVPGLFAGPARAWRRRRTRGSTRFRRTGGAREFYQFVPGPGPPFGRHVRSGQIQRDTAFEVTVPRRYFRGDPESWGYAVAVMGRAAGGGPMTVKEEPGPDFFGGGVVGRRGAAVRGFVGSRRPVPATDFGGLQEWAGHHIAVCANRIGGVYENPS
jgi:hypothetical protein